MKTKIAMMFFSSAIILSACGGVTPYPTPTIPLPTSILATATPIPKATSLPSATSIPWSTPTLETLFGYPTPQAAVSTFTCDSYSNYNTGSCRLTPNIQRADFSVHEIYVGKYVLRNWCDTNWIDVMGRCVVTISAIGVKQLEIWGYGTSWLGTETGADLTGDGIPDIIIDTTTGAADGGAGIIVYEAGPTLKKIMDVGSQDPGNFKDLNDDGAYEYIAPTRIWSKFSNCQVWTPIVYEYQGKSGYVPATSKFKDILASAIQDNIKFIAEFKKQNPNMPLLFADYNQTETAIDKKYWQYAIANNNYLEAVNDLYDLAVYYLLTGQTKDAWNVLNDNFSPDKASEYMLGIQKDLQGFLAP